MIGGLKVESWWEQRNYFFYKLFPAASLHTVLAGIGAGLES
jgi:hypothetical protein